MEKEKIGLNAGLIWQKMEVKGEMSINELKKITKLDVKQLYLALGWLARENKVLLNSDKEELHISLL
ncbi:MAG: hypothetical protein EHM46_00685 [Bacteroidetes bacterium]|nr:MAG: hypothetical protein EHM46_00685 [Bacteroidota bacterium]